MPPQAEGGIKRHLPSIIGWLSESNTFRALTKACADNLGKKGRRIGIMRGPDHATTDGAIIVDPPEDFPFGNLTAAWHWALKNRESAALEELNVLRFDAKLGISSVKSQQWAPFFIVTVPEFAQHICIVPVRSYARLYTVAVRAHTAPAAKSPLHTDRELVFNNLLAPFCVHKDDIYDALISLVDASINRGTYVNPTNGVKFHGWKIPPPEPTLINVFGVREGHQANARDAVERLERFIRAVPSMHLALNPVNPLICDVFLVDEDENVSYHIEHKSYASEYNTQSLLTRPLMSWTDEKLNWHFLFCQSGDDLVIYTRSGQRDSDSMVMKPVIIDMTAPDSIITFANTIRCHGRAARLRLCNKWKDVDTYDDTVDVLADGSVYLAEKLSSFTNMGRLFREEINKQCCKLRRHICILLDNHPCANGVIIEHTWSDQDVELYESSGLVPVSLVNKTTSLQRCILIKFIPHTLPPKTTSTSRLFEPAWGAAFDVPACTAHDFIYVAMPGGITTEDHPLNLDTVFLLQSTLTTVLGNTKVCQKCHNQTDPREWTEIRCRVRNEDLGMRKERFSLTQYPCIDPSAKPLEKLFAFGNGSVHAYFDDIFMRSDGTTVTTVRGPLGILQTQWNHGEMRSRQPDRKKHPTYQLLQRIVAGLYLPPDVHQTSPIVAFRDSFRVDFQQRQEEMKTTTGFSERVAKARALEEFANDSDRGTTLRDLVALAGFTTEMEGLHCDHCPNEESCRFLHPAIAYTLPGTEEFRCAGCHGRQAGNAATGPCTIRNMPLEVVKQLFAFPSFRVHVPCHECWKDGRLCDNYSDSCGHCLESGISCDREACNAFYELRGTWFCHVDCDKAHCNDGYTNVVYAPRSGEGYNAQQAAWEAVAGGESRVAVCTECWKHFRDQICTNDKICPPCEARMRKGEHISCRRIKCKRFASCSNVNCTLAHPAQSFHDEDLDAFGNGRPGRWRN